MDKLLVCNLDLLKVFDGYENSRNNRDRLLEYFETFENYREKNHIVFYSRDNSLLETAKKRFLSEGIDYFMYVNRKDIRIVLTDPGVANNKFVVIGGKDVDFQLAANTRALFVVPTWIPTEEKALRYGIHVTNPNQLFQLVMALNNQKHWFAKLKIDEQTRVYCLMDGRYGYYAKDDNERDMVMHFQALLKQGTAVSYYQILLYHFLAAMTNSKRFDDIEIFGMIPSSNCEYNEYIHEFMEHVREIKGKQGLRKASNKNFLIRKTQKLKAHETVSSAERAVMGGQHEFETLCINPEWKPKIKKLKKEGRFNVMIIDDYMTHGNTFNAVRNMLESIGVNKIIFISLGYFGKAFQKKDYLLEGSVFDTSYTYKLISTEVQYPIIDDGAKEEVSNLYKIFNTV